MQFIDNFDELLFAGVKMITQDNKFSKLYDEIPAAAP